jgi:hypothetical protein
MTDRQRLWTVIELQDLLEKREDTRHDENSFCYQGVVPANEASSGIAVTRLPRVEALPEALHVPSYFPMVPILMLLHQYTQPQAAIPLGPSSLRYARCCVIDYSRDSCRLPTQTCDPNINILPLMKHNLHMCR